MIKTRIAKLEEKIYLLEGKSDKHSSIMFEDDHRLYHYQLIDGEKVKIYPTQEELDSFRSNSKTPIIIIDTSLDMENKTSHATA